MPPPDAPAPGGALRRGWRDHPIGRVVALIAVLTVAFGFSRACAADRELNADEALAKAEKLALFDYDSHQIRFLRQGIPSRGFWIVSFYDGTPTNPTRVQIVRIDAATGKVVPNTSR